MTEKKTEKLDRYKLAARLDKYGDVLMKACENFEELPNRVAICNQLGAVCRIATTLKMLRTEDRAAQPEAGIAGSAVRKYASEFAAGGGARRAAGGGPALYLDSDDEDDDGSPGGDPNAA